jgi:hypothetical protein
LQSELHHLLRTSERDHIHNLTDSLKNDLL